MIHTHTHTLFRSIAYTSQRTAYKYTHIHWASSRGIERVKSEHEKLETAKKQKQKRQPNTQKLLYMRKLLCFFSLVLRFPREFRGCMCADVCMGAVHCVSLEIYWVEALVRVNKFNETMWLLLLLLLLLLLFSPNVLCSNLKFISFSSYFIILFSLFLHSVWCLLSITAVK